MGVDVGVDAGLRAGDKAQRGRDRHAVEADLAIARDPRQLRLRRGAQLGDVVQVQGPAARRGDAAVGGHRFQIGRRLRQRLAEQQAVDAGGIAGIARHGHERRGRRAAAPVQFARDRPDAGAGLPGDEDAALECRAAPDQFLHARDRRRSANELDGALIGALEALGSCLDKHKWICHSLDSS